jgi:hypothetical protein
MAWNLFAALPKSLKNAKRSRRPTFRPVVQILEDRWVPAKVIATLDSAVSTLTLSGTTSFGNLAQQGAGSLTTHYHGTIAFDYDPVMHTATFLGAADGTNIVAENSGNWQPMPGGASGSAPANYGAEVVVLFMPQYAAMRNLVSATSSASPVSVAGGTFNASQLSFTIISGNFDYAAPLFGQMGSSALSGTGSNMTSTPGSFTDHGNGAYDLTVPIDFSMSGMLGTVGTYTITVTGSVTAHAHIPVVTPSAFSAAFVAGGGPVSVTSSATTITTTNTSNVLSSVTATLSPNPDGAGVTLAADTSAFPGMTASYDPNTGTLTISGSGFTVSNYTTVVRTITFNDSAPNPTAGNFTITLEANDGLNSSFPSTTALVVQTLPVLGDAGFEIPVLPSGTYQADPSGTPWVFTPTTGIAANGSSYTSSNPNAPEGNQVAYLQGGSSDTESISQTLTFPSGNFFVQFKAAQGTGNPSSQTFDVQIDGATIGTFSPSGLTYASFTTSVFPATYGSHTLSFVGRDPDGMGNTALIDQVQFHRSLANFGFEVPSVGATVAYDPTGGPPAIAYSGDAGVAGNGSSLTSGNPAAPQGSQVGFVQDTGSFSGTGGLNAGTYTISFMYAEAGVNSGSQSIQIMMDGNPLGPVLTPPGTTYTAGSVTFTTTDFGRHTFTFVGLDSSGQMNTVLFDELAIYQV